MKVATGTHRFELHNDEETGRCCQNHDCRPFQDSRKASEPARRTVRVNQFLNLAGVALLYAAFGSIRLLTPTFFLDEHSIDLEWSKNVSMKPSIKNGPSIL